MEFGILNFEVNGFDYDNAARRSNRVRGEFADRFNRMRIRLMDGRYDVCAVG